GAQSSSGELVQVEAGPPPRRARGLRAAGAGGGGDGGGGVPPRGPGRVVGGGGGGGAPPRKRVGGGGWERSGQAPVGGGGAERRPGDRRQPALRAASDHAAAEGFVVEEAQGDLHRGDGGQLQCLVELAPVDVGEADAADQPGVQQRGQRAHAGGPVGARV